MNIAAEKEEIIKRINEEQDENIIISVKTLLNNSFDLHSLNDEALERELDISIREADNGEELPYEEVSAKYRKKYLA